MADGKQWYNSPQDKGRDKKKAAGKSAVQAKTGVKPAAKSSGAPVSGQNGKKAVKSSGKPVSGKPVAKPGQPIKNGQQVKSSQPVKNGQSGKNSQQAKQVKKQNKGLFGFGKANKKPDPFVAEYKKAQADAASDKSIIPEMNGAAQASSKDSGKGYSKEQAKRKEQAKILDQERKKEQAKLKEQAKIEKNEYTRKNPSQKSAESRAIRNGILGAVAVAAALFVLVFVVHHLYDYIAEKPNFSFVTTGAVEHTIGAKALIVRDEDTINAVAAGELVTQITEGSRVAKGQSLAIVVPDNMKSAVTDLRNVQSQISDVQQELILAGNVAEADIIYRNYNKNLSAILDSVRFDSMGGNLTNMSSYSASVSVILDEREDEMSKINFDDERISVLRSEEKVYEAQVEKYATVVEAHRPGIVSFRLDGKEELLDYDSFLTMPAAEIKGYLNNSVGAITADLSVDENAPACRIAQNESQYLTVYPFIVLYLLSNL